jgi:hypothetical protein
MHGGKLAQEDVEPFLSLPPAYVKVYYLAIQISFFSADLSA